ncbi:MAG TPA: ABC transporter permease, partial [bacterium]|nr:ABC transporter permease [bacterium]
MSRTLRELRRYPSAIAGLAIIGLLVAISVYAVVAIPYGEAIRLWNGGEGVWQRTPRNAWPAWLTVFPGVHLSRTVVVNSTGAPRQEAELGSGVRQVTVSLPFDLPYESFPQELAVFWDTTYTDKAPQVTLAWRRPDGTEIALADLSVKRADSYRISSDQQLQQAIGGRPEVALFADKSHPDQPLRGRYELVIRGYL